MVSIRDDELGDTGDDVIGLVNLELDTSANSRSTLRLVGLVCIASAIHIISWLSVRRHWLFSYGQPTY